MPRITREDLSEMSGVVMRDGPDEGDGASEHVHSKSSGETRRLDLPRARHRRGFRRGDRGKLARALVALLVVALIAVAISWLLGAFTANEPRFLVPLYDESAADWSRACSALRGTSSLTVANIGNPGGPGDTPSSAWKANLVTCDGDQVGVLGYVDTDYCQVPLAAAEGQIDRWYRWYGSVGLRGIFFDRVANPSDPANGQDCLAESSSADAYYRTLASYVHSLAGGPTVVYNFGLNPHSAWALSAGAPDQRADIVVIFEDSSLAYARWSPAGWEAGYPATSFSILVDSASGADQPSSFCAAASMQHVGYRYATPFASWNRLPPPGYLSREVPHC